MSYGFKFYNSSGEIVLDDNYIKPWFAGKAVPLSVSGPYNGYNNDKWYAINYQTPGIGSIGNFAAITLPNSSGEYWTDGSWSQGSSFTVNVYFPISYTPTTSDVPEVYCFSVNPVNPRTVDGYGLQLRRSDQQCTFDSNKTHFKPYNAVSFTMPYRYATGYFSTSTGCGNPANQANCSQIVTLSNVPTKAAFILPYFSKSQAYTRYTGQGNFSYLFDFQAVYKRSATNEVTVRVATLNYENMEGFVYGYDFTQGSEGQYIIYVDGTNYDVGGGSIEFPSATYSLSASPATVDEGNNVVVTLTTTGVPNGTSVPWLISGSNITSEDFSFGGLLTGSFVVQNNTASVTIPTTRNENSEGTEEATFSLTNNAASIGFNINNVPYYTTPNITSFSYSPATPDETNNKVVTFTINVQDNTVSGAPRDFYWAIEGGANVTGDDFDGLIYGTLTTENGAGTRSFSITIKQDFATENAQEQFRVNFYTAGPYVGIPFYQSSYITIADTSKDRPVINYFQIKPNSTGTYSTSVTGLSGETPYFKWDVSNATSVSINNSVGTVASSGTDVALAGAVLNATTWTLTATNQYGSVTSSVTFNVSASTYQLSTSATSINEGGSVTITLTTTNVLNGTQVPYSINSSAFDASDWSGGALSSSGIFTVNNNTASRTFTSLADVRTDGNKTLTITLTNYPQVTVSTTILDTSTCPADGTYIITQCLANYVERNTYYTGNYSGGVCTTRYVDTPNSVFCGYVSYTISPSTTNITEGGSVTYTVNVTNVANGTTLYWTNSGTTGTSQGTVTISSSGNYGSGSFTINTSVSNTYDGARTIIANLRTGGYAGTVVATASTVTVADAPTTWSLSQSSTSITEGGSISYTITTTNLVTPAAGIYWEQIGTAGSSDMSATSGTIGADGSGTYSLTVNTTVDATYNTTLKTVQIRFRNVNSSGAILATSQATTLSNAAPTYDISAYPASVNETTSALVTFSINCTNVQNGTTLYWANTGSVSASDFTDNTNSGNVSISNNTATFTRTIARDQAYENTENIVMELRTSAGGSAVDSVTVPVSDTSQQADWEILGPSSMNEGTTATYFVTGTTYVATWGVTRVYLTIRHSSSSSSDVSISNPGGLILSGDAGEAAFTVTTVADSTTEGSETFYLDLTVGGSVQASYGPITINDTSTTPVYSNVQINSITWSPTSVDESTTITFTVNATDNTTSGAPRNFYYAVIGGANNTSADYSGSISGTLTSQNGTFTRTFTISIAADQLVEGAESFQIGIYKDGAYVGSPYYTTSSISISDTSVPPYYSNVQINSITWSPNSVDEGASVTFTLNGTDNSYSGAPRNFYYASIGSLNTTGADFSGNGYGTLTSANGSFTRTFTVSFTADQLTEGPETFKIGIYKDGPYQGNPYYETALITINDTSVTPSYTLTRSVSSVNEGGSFSITFNTNQAGSYGYTITGVSSADIGGASLTGTVSNGSVLTYNVTADNTTEGAETFTITLNNGLATTSVTINDTSQLPFYSLTRSAASVNEGGSFSITFNTNQAGSYGYTITGVSSADIGGASLTGTFTYDEESRTYNVTADSTTEGAETFTMSLNNGQASSSVTINDTSVTPNPPTINYFQIKLSGGSYGSSVGPVSSSGATPFFRWSVSAATSVTISGIGGDQGASGNEAALAGNVTTTTTWTLTATNGAGSVTSQVTMYVCSPAGTWDGSSYVCSGSNKYKLVSNGNCGTQQGDLWVANDYAACCTASGTYLGNTRCVGSTVQREYANGQCGSYWQDYAYNQYSTCCPADGTWDGSSYVCSGANKYKLVANGQCGTRQGDLLQANAYSTCCAADGTWDGVSYNCYGTTNKYKVVANGQCGTRQGDLVQSNAYSYCCTPDGTWDGASYSCYGTTNKYKVVANGQCGTRQGDLVQANAYSYCCPADGTWLGYYDCYGTQNKYQVVANGQCGTRQGPLAVANDYATCCTASGTWTGATQCSGSTLQRQYHNGQCGYYWADYQYNAYSSCCTASGTWTGNTRCSGTTLQREYHNGQCGTYWGDYQYNAYSSCCPADGTFLYYSCYGTPHKYQVVANGQCGERQGSIVQYNAYSFCCTPAGFSGATQCEYWTSTYGYVAGWYNDGQCGGYWAALEPNQYCCLGYGTFLYSYCASSNYGNNNKINVYSGGGSPTGCNAYTTTEYNASECYVNPPANTIDCSATSPADPNVGTTISWNVNGPCSGNNVYVYASNGSTAYLPCSGTISGVGAGQGLSGYHFLQFSYNGATCYAWVNFMYDSGGGA